VIILYDGECRFCRWAVAWALDRDERRAVHVAPIQSSTGARLLADIAPAERLREVHVVHDDGRRESGGTAARAVLSALPSTRRLARLADLSPRATDALYAFVADHRGQFGRLVPDRAKRRADRVLTNYTRPPTRTGVKE
jgi:predicted DCC family thiol-disulfide oxidoreductase YuxK